MRQSLTPSLAPALTLALTLGVALAPSLVATAARADTKLRLVEVITSPPRTELLKKQIAAFEAANPGTTVDVVSLPWGQAFEKFLTMVQAGDVPDIAEMPERWLGLYGANGQLEDLGPFTKSWSDYSNLGDRAKELGSVVDGKLMMVPYGYYIRALFWNKKLFAAAGLQDAPKTMDEFAADAKTIAAKVPGKFGYCLRGGPGGFTGVQIFMNTMAGKGGFFNPDGTSILDEPGAVKGLAMVGDLYKSGAAPKDSVSWGFNEIVSGFYTGTCAMLDQDPDALIGVAEKMNKDDFAVAALPLGPSGKAYPSLGYAGWSMFSASKSKPEAWKLIAFLSAPDRNIEWSKFVGTLPIYKGADKDPFFATPQYAGWFEELNGPDRFTLVTVPSHLENLGIFFDQMAPKGIQQVLLGQREPKDVAGDWAKYLTGEQQAWMAKHKN